jgi:hypothetical protein
MTEHFCASCFSWVVVSKEIGRINQYFKLRPFRYRKIRVIPILAREGGQ